MASPAVFARNIRRRGQAIPTKVNKVIRQMAGAILQTVILATPVDTGRARGGWQVGLGSSPKGNTGRLDRGGGAAIAAGRARIAGRRSEQTIFITNNVEYVIFLNAGSSSQAPSNFVAKATRAGIRSLGGSKLR